MQFIEHGYITAVVPIITNVGAAVLPTLLAALGTLVAIAFRPRELLRLCRESPAAVAKGVGVLAVLIVAGVIGYHFFASVGGTQRAVAAQPQYDWQKIAENIIAQENAGKIATTDVATPSTSSNKTADNEGRDSDATNNSPTHSEPTPPRLTLSWSYQPEDAMFLAKAAALGNRIYVAGCQSDLGSYTGILACLDADTGRPLWEVSELDNEPLRPFFSSPALSADGKYLVIGQGLHEDRDCSLLCFETASGKLKWRVKTPLHIESSPLVHGDLAVVGAGAIEDKSGQPTSDPGFVFAVRVSDGLQVWRQAVNDPESSPTMDADGVVYIGSGFNGCAVVALRSEADDGLRETNQERLKWRRQLDYPITGPVVLADDAVLAGGGNGDLVHSNRNARGSVTLLDRTTGAIRWTAPFADSVLGGVAVAYETVFCPVRTGEVAALALADGTPKWHTRISGDAPILAGCLAHGTRVFAVSSDGYLAVLDAESGELIEKTYLNDQGKPGSGLTASTPVLHNGRLIVGSETGGVRCFVGAGFAK
jgi:outer membrane protein assembly factor BamB